MDFNGIREIIYGVVSEYFAGTTVIWAEQIATRPPIPYVTLKMMNIDREAFPVEDKNGVKCYQCSTTIDVNLHTNGMEMLSGDNMTTNYQNTATQDMMDFVNYMESEGVTDILAENCIDVSLIPPVRDLSELQNDTMYRYRSMAEFSVAFAMEVSGRYGVGAKQRVPDSSGGGTTAIATAEEGYFEEVEIEGGAE